MRRKSLLYAVIFILAVTLLSSCSKQGNASSSEMQLSNMEKGIYDYNDSYTSGIGGAPVPAMENSSVQYEGEYYGETAQEQKKIKNGTVNMETKGFDDAVSTLKGIVNDWGGYLESSNVSVYNNKNGVGLRQGSFSVRIPADGFDSVRASIEALGSVTSSSSSETDATEQYYDIAARLQTKELEEQRLLSFINEAKDVSDLIALEQRLSEVRAEIERYKSRMLNIDRLSSYSRLYVYITEVMDIYSTETFADRVKKSFKNSISAIVEFFQNAAIFITGAFLPVVIIAVIVLFAVMVYKMLSRKKQRK